jgi:hypothetical protein
MSIVLMWSDVADDAVQADANQRADRFVQSRIVHHQVDRGVLGYIRASDRAKLIVELRQQRTGEMVVEEGLASARVEHGDITSVLQSRQVGHLQQRR